MASHDELISELPRLDKLSNAARLKHAKKRRLKQLKGYQEYVRQQRALAASASTTGGAGNIMKKRSATKVSFEEGSILNDMVSRNELLEGTCRVRVHVLRAKLLRAWWEPRLCGGMLLSRGSGWGETVHHAPVQVTCTLHLFVTYLFQGQNGCGLYCMYNNTVYNV